VISECDECNVCDYTGSVDRRYAHAHARMAGRSVSTNMPLTLAKVREMGPAKLQKL
jgi:hypothetical protein